MNRIQKLIALKRLMMEAGKMENIKRFSTRILHEKQSVSSHACLVAVNSVVLGTFLNEVNNRKIVDINFMCKLAIFHDLEEGTLGDLLMPTKQNSVISKEYDKLADEYYKKIIKPVDSKIYDVYCSTESFERNFLKLCDKIEGLYFSYRQCKYYNNTTFYDIFFTYYDVIQDKINSLELRYPMIYGWQEMFDIFVRSLKIEMENRS